MRAVQVTSFGGPEVLTSVELPDPVPAPGQLLVHVSRAGVNYADTHQTEDSYLAPQKLPLVPGAEVVGTIIGGDRDGQRVVALTDGGGYAERTVVNPALAFPLDGASSQVHDGQALALVLQGATAWHILRASAHLAHGESVVVHAAAGGVGSLAVQLAKAWGAGRVIATASSEQKRALALDLGADVAIDPGEEDLNGALREANGGRPVDVVLEMTGGPVFDASLRALAPFGRLVTYGMASRQAPTPVTSGDLMAHSSAVIGFWLAHCFRRPLMMAAAMEELLAMTAAGHLRPVVGGEYPLSEARRAHEDIRARISTGKLVLDPAR